MNVRFSYSLFIIDISMYFDSKISIDANPQYGGDDKERRVCERDSSVESDHCLVDLSRVHVAGSLVSSDIVPSALAT